MPAPHPRPKKFVDSVKESVVEIHHSPDVIVLRDTGVADNSRPMND